MIDSVLQRRYENALIAIIKFYHHNIDVHTSKPHNYIFLNVRERQKNLRNTFLF